MNGTETINIQLGREKPSPDRSVVQQDTKFLALDYQSLFYFTYA